MDEQTITKHAEEVTQLAHSLQNGMVLADGFEERVAVLEAAAKVYSAVLFRDTIEKLIKSVEQSG